MTEQDRPATETGAGGGIEPAATPPEWVAPASSGAPTDYEPAATSAPVAPVLPPRPRSRLRWGIALLVAAVVVGVSAAGAWLLTGRESASNLAAWMPADSVVYEELRFDLPGDQRQKLGTFLAHFPGFDDQSILDQKLAEVYDRVIRAATQDKHDYSADVKPWFGGQVAFALGALPDIDTTSSTAPTDFRALGAISVVDATAADAWLRKILDEAGASYTTADRAGTQMLVFGGAPVQGAIAIRQQTMLLGDRTSVERALDGNGSGGLASSDAFRKAQETNDADRLVGFYLDLKAYMAWTLRMGERADPSAVAGLQSLTDYLPAWMAGSVRAEGDAIASDFAMPHNSQLPMPANARSALADHLPTTTLFAYDVNDYGPVLLKSLDLYRTNPMFSAAMQQVDQAANLLGGFDKLLGWVGETAVVVDRDATTPGGGIVIAPKDRAAAEQLAVQLKNLIALGGASAGVSAHDQPYAGTTITTLDIGDASRFTGQATGLPISGHVEVAWAVTDQVVVVGFGDAFVKRVLDTKADASLGADGRFKGLADRIGEHSGLLFADLTAIRDMAEAALPAASRQSYEANIKPYLAPFDAVTMGFRTGSDVDTARMLVTVR